MIEAAGWIVEVLVSKKVDIDAVLGFVYLGNLGQDEKEGVKMQVQKRRIVKTAVLKKIKTEKIL